MGQPPQVQGPRFTRSSARFAISVSSGRGKARPFHTIPPPSTRLRHFEQPRDDVARHLVRLDLSSLPGGRHRVRCRRRSRGWPSGRHVSRPPAVPGWQVVGDGDRRGAHRDLADETAHAGLRPGRNTESTPHVLKIFCDTWGACRPAWSRLRFANGVAFMIVVWP